MSSISIASNDSVVNNAGIPIKKRQRKKENIQTEETRLVWDRKPELTVNQNQSKPTRTRFSRALRQLHVFSSSHLIGSLDYLCPNYSRTSGCDHLSSETSFPT